MRQYSPKPFDSLNSKGFVGRAASKVGNTIIEKPIQKLSYKLTSRKYRKGVDSPAKGSNLYNKNYFNIKKILKFIIGGIVTLLSGGTIYAFIKASLIGKIGLGFGISCIILIICLIKARCKKKHK